MLLLVSVTAPLQNDEAGGRTPARCSPALYRILYLYLLVQSYEYRTTVPYRTPSSQVRYDRTITYALFCHFTGTV